MKKRILALALCFITVFCALPFAVAADTANVVEDSALLAYLIEEGYDIDNDGGISATEMEEVWFIEASGKGISSLEGLQYATNLLLLELNDNNISDISPLAGLDIRAVELNYNNISGTIDFAQMGWAIADNINLGYNKIESVKNISELTSAVYLDLSYNKLSDITELLGFTTLETLRINDNCYSLDPSGDDYSYFEQIRSENSNLHTFVYQPQLVGSITEDFAISFNDSKLLEALLANGVDVTGDGKISACELGNVYSELDLSGYGIADITGLEYAINTPSINLSENKITSVNALAGLKQLRTLDISDNSIESIVALLNLVNLTSLNAGGNKLVSIGAVSNLTVLTSLDLSRNSITDVSALKDLTALKKLNLSDNFISSAQFASSFDSLDLSYNVFTTTADLVVIKANTLDITYNNLDASNISASDFADVTTVVYAQQTEYDGSYRDVVEFPDDVLLNILLEQEYINVDGDNVITKGELASFNGILNLKGTGVTDITGLRYMKRLNTLRLDNTAISDISEVAYMTRLEVFTAANSNISDITPLTQLEKLQYMTLPRTKVTSIDALKNNKLYSLISINLMGNGLTDVSALKNIPTLKIITLTSNTISDISFLSSITAPENLYFNDNEIENIDVIYDLTTLKELDVSYNWIDIPLDFPDAMHNNNSNLVKLVYDNQKRKAVADVIIKATGSDNFFTLEKDGYDYDIQNDYSEFGVVVGTKFTVVALEEDSEFLYWKNENGVIVSYDEEYSFVLVSAIRLTAVFKQTSSRGAYVSFFTAFSQELSRIFYSNDAVAEDIQIPLTDPYNAGYEFVGWSIDGKTAIAKEQLGAEIVAALPSGYVALTPIYVVSGSLCTVTVVNGTGGGSFATGTPVEVTANAPEDGYKFAYWVDDLDHIVGYDESYYFIVTGDITLTAVYVADDEEVEKQALITITDKSADAQEGTIKFVAVRDIPAEYTIVQTGILITNDASIGLDENAFVIGATGVLMGTAASNTNQGTYIIRKTKVQPGDTWYARGYVVYMDASGELIYIYSALESMTLEG